MVFNSIPVKTGAAELELLLEELLATELELEDELLLTEVLLEVLLDELLEELVVESDDVRDVCELSNELAEETLLLEDLLVPPKSQATAIEIVNPTRSNAFKDFFMMISFLLMSAYMDARMHS